MVAGLLVFLLIWFQETFKVFIINWLCMVGPLYDLIIRKYKQFNLGCNTDMQKEQIYVGSGLLWGGGGGIGGHCPSMYPVCCLYCIRLLQKRGGQKLCDPGSKDFKSLDPGSVLISIIYRMNVQIYLYSRNSTNTNRNNILGLFYLNICTYQWMKKFV